VYPVPNYPIQVGNAIPNALSEKQHIFDLFERPRLEAKRQQLLYNAIKRPQHKATWNAVFANAKKGGTRKKLPKSNTPKFRKQVINTITARRNLSYSNKARLIQRYTEAAQAGLATPDEISALVSLAELKHYTPKTLRRRR
jgi:hypothetical protein